MSNLTTQQKATAHAEKIRIQYEAVTMAALAAAWAASEQFNLLLGFAMSQNLNDVTTEIALEDNSKELTELLKGLEIFEAFSGDLISSIIPLLVVGGTFAFYQYKDNQHCFQCHYQQYIGRL